jgi:hypothetical protein
LVWPTWFRLFRFVIRKLFHTTRVSPSAVQLALSLPIEFRYKSIVLMIAQGIKNFFECSLHWPDQKSVAACNSNSDLPAASVLFPSERARFGGQDWILGRGQPALMP